MVTNVKACFMTDGRGIERLQLQTSCNGMRYPLPHVRATWLSALKLIQALREEAGAVTSPRGSLMVLAMWRIGLYNVYRVVFCIVRKSEKIHVL